VSLQRSPCGQGQTSESDPHENPASDGRPKGRRRQAGRAASYLDGDAPLARAAAEAGVSLRTARRWLARCRSAGPAGLARRPRPEAGSRKIARELVERVEGLALTKPRLSAAAIHRCVSAWARERGWPTPSYSSQCLSIWKTLLWEPSGCSDSPPMRPEAATLRGFPNSKNLLQQRPCDHGGARS
jgi:transposase